MKRFEELDISQNIVLSLKDMGFDKATEVQERTIPLIKEGFDLAVRSKTGSGKTAAFGIPIVEQEKRALVLAPTRELALQITDHLIMISKRKNNRIACVYGGVSIDKQIKELNRGVDILVATPGRLIDLFNRGVIDLTLFEVVVLDEADQMLDLGFIEDIRFILSNTSVKAQLLLFSATLNSKLLHLIKEFMSDSKFVEIDEEEVSIKQKRIEIERSKKFKLLLNILFKSHGKTIVFSSTRKSVEYLGKRLMKIKGLKAGYIHGGLSQRRREQVISKFRNGQLTILVATDVAARGIDVEGITTVINYDEARDARMHTHRIGRTGRMGKRGVAITFVEKRVTSQPQQIYSRQANRL